MAGKVLNMKVCSPLKMRSSLTGKCHEICHYSYNLPLGNINAEPRHETNYNNISNFDWDFNSSIYYL